MSARVLVIDDDRSLLELLASYLGRQGYEVTTASSGQEGLRTFGEGGAAGALMFTCNGRGRSMFGHGDHDAAAFEGALGAPLGGFFCAGEIGPVSGRNFLHGFTATLAIFPRD